MKANDLHSEVIHKYRPIKQFGILGSGKWKLFGFWDLGFANSQNHGRGFDITCRN